MSGPLIAECIRVIAYTGVSPSITVFESYEIKSALNLINTYVKDNISFTVECK